MSADSSVTRRAALSGALALAALPAIARSQATGVKRLLGIRYGRAKRFMPPEPVEWGMVDLDLLNAFGPACPQPGRGYAPQDDEILLQAFCASRR